MVFQDTLSLKTGSFNIDNGGLRKFKSGLPKEGCPSPSPCKKNNQTNRKKKAIHTLTNNTETTVVWWLLTWTSNSKKLLGIYNRLEKNCMSCMNIYTCDGFLFNLILITLYLQSYGSTSYNFIVSDWWFFRWLGLGLRFTSPIKCHNITELLLKFS